MLQYGKISFALRMYLDKDVLSMMTSKERKASMATTPNSRNQKPNTYFVQDLSNKEELARLLLQDQTLTSGMGGTLPEQPDPGIFFQVLDVGCGTGGWLLEVARNYPGTLRLMGIDINPRTIEYAREQAKIQQVSERVTFQVMDTLRRLDLPTNSHDLINMRMGASFLRVWDWSALLQEFQRVARPGGVIRVTETDMIEESNSPALNALSNQLIQAFHHAGHLFTPEHTGLLNQLPRLFHQSGLRNIQTYCHTLEYKPGSVGWESFYEDMRHIFRTMRPFLQKWTRIPANYDVLCQQALNEMQQADFMAKWVLVTLWGNKTIS